jgi:hypothetical protein
MPGIKVSLKGWSGKDIQSAVSLQNISVGGTFLCFLILGQIFPSVTFNNLKRVLGAKRYSDTQIRNAVAGTRSSLFESCDAVLELIKLLKVRT